MDRLINSPSDTQLLLRLKQEDHAAFQLIFDKYWKRLYRYAYSIYRDEAICEDCVQEIFISLWEKSKETDILHLENYLFKALKYKLSGQIKKLKFDNTHKDALKLLSESVSADEQSPLEYKELEQTLSSHIAQLPGKCHEVFVLSRINHKSNSEIAQELNISKRTVETHISNALKLLRTKMSETSYFLVLITLRLF
ncbi:RNA polymerase sigma-70 factor [Echinicola sediminis]